MLTLLKNRHEEEFHLALFCSLPVVCPASSKKKPLSFCLLSVTLLSENCSLLGTDDVRGQISQHIFTPNGDYCVKYSLNIFHNTCSFENWGMLPLYTQVYKWELAIMLGEPCNGLLVASCYRYKDKMSH